MVWVVFQIVGLPTSSKHFFSGNARMLCSVRSSKTPSLYIGIRGVLAPGVLKRRALILILLSQYILV